MHKYGKIWQAYLLLLIITLASLPLTIVVFKNGRNQQHVQACSYGGVRYVASSSY